MLEPRQAAAQSWDLLVIGGGMGGGAAAFEAARHGKRVLLIDMGHFDISDDPHNTAGLSEDASFRMARGRWPYKMKADVDDKASTIWPTLGCGFGGSSLLYAAALNRLEPQDMSSRTMPSGESVCWPFAFEDLEPHYAELESLFRVNGTADPLSRSSADLLPPPAMGERDRHFFEQMNEAGLNPYRSHNAIEYLEGCSECSGHFCPRACKGDARNRLIIPAMAGGNLFILQRCKALRLIANGAAIIGAEVECEDERVTIEAVAIALAAGALNTPALLLRSVCKHWPQGIGNQHDQVGRNLMFHASDFICIWPRRKVSRDGPGRSIALRDFYQVGSDKMGEVQSMGLGAGYAEILTYLHQRFDMSPLKHIPLLRHLLRIPAFLGARLFDDASVFATIVEDFPYPENRVREDPESATGFSIHYRVAPELRERVKRLRHMLKQRLPALRIMVVNREVTLNYGHACGTCRAGTDPRSSVVDSNCKVHDTDNLYIVDGSFMPTSGGTNPSLTIAANGMRVGAHLSKLDAKMDHC